MFSLAFWNFSSYLAKNSPRKHLKEFKKGKIGEYSLYGAGEERQEDQQQTEAALHEAIQRLPETSRNPRDSLQCGGEFTVCRKKLKQFTAVCVGLKCIVFTVYSIVKKLNNRQS